jgi:hypothetical protein
MAGDPRKKKQDARRVSQQPWEQTYQKRKKKDTNTNPSGSREGKQGGRDRSR